MILLAAKYLPNGPSPINPILGGLAIGIAQALLMLLSRTTIGVSGAHNQLGRDFWNLISPSNHTKPASRSIMWFAIGIILGAKALTSQVPMLMGPAETQQVGIGPLTLLLGGAIMVFGAGLADGCPSGHGISGMAALSTASIVTVAAMFAGGIAWRAMFG
jgi:uncharacterized membrane protein YedE/YeeE